MSLPSRFGLLLTALLLSSPLPTTAGLPTPAANTKVLYLRTNSLTNPLGIVVGAPRLSWQLDSNRRGTTQPDV